MNRAACEGQWRLFDSIDPYDHAQAAALCATCPLSTECAQVLRQIQHEAGHMASRGGGAVGTWAGELVGSVPRKTLPPIEHGTHRGAWTHRNRKDPVCVECKAAEAAYLAEMRAQNPRPRKANVRTTWENKSEPDRGVSAPQPGSDRSTFSRKEAAGEQHCIATHRHAN